MIPDVAAVRPLKTHRLWVRFGDGAEGEVDIAAHVIFQGVFEPLRDPEYFSRVRVEEATGTISWPNGADVDSAVLYWWVTGRKPYPFAG
jgi:hypothetical protein